MKLYCYHISPIDFWPGIITRKDLLNDMIATGQDDEDSGPRRLNNLQSKAEEGFKMLKWEGDVREGPYFFAIPADTEMAIGFILKQDNNGSTFIASPYELPHLEIISMVPKFVIA